MHRYLEKKFWGYFYQFTRGTILTKQKQTNKSLSFTVSSSKKKKKQHYMDLKIISFSVWFLLNSVLQLNWTLSRKKQPCHILFLNILQIYYMYYMISFGDGKMSTHQCSGKRLLHSWPLSSLALSETSLPTHKDGRCINISYFDFDAVETPT